MPCVLDACAVIAFLRNEPGAHLVRQKVEEKDAIIHAVNLCEVYYDFVRYAGRSVAQRVLDDLADAGIGVDEDMSWSLISAEGDIKVGEKLSLADSFAVALAQREARPVITSDRKEFAPLADAGVCRVEFFR